MAKDWPILICSDCFIQRIQMWGVGDDGTNLLSEAIFRPETNVKLEISIIYEIDLLLMRLSLPAISYLQISTSDDSNLNLCQYSGQS